VVTWLVLFAILLQLAAKATLLVILEAYREHGMCI